MKHQREMKDSFLAKRAQSGDKEAFAQLVREHRSRMLGWAHRIIRNEAGAEDIVQDALMLVLKRMDSLTNPEKFVPWLRTIVRNQAFMSVRGLRHTSEILTGESSDDTVMGYPRTSEFNNDPEALVIARLALEQTRKLMAKLGDKERAVVQSYCLEGLSVQEVAAKLGMKSGAVYTAISRSRTKLMEACYDEEIDRLIRARRKAGRPPIVWLDTAKVFRLTGAYNSMAAGMLTTAVSMGRKDVTLTDIMGWTGHAFRIQVSQDLGLSSTYGFEWRHAARSGWNHLGYSVTTFGGDGVYLHRPDELIVAMEAIFAALEQGIPVMAWHVSNPEFGLITGFDDKARVWFVTDSSACGKKLPYVKLGQRTEWFVAVPSRQRLSYERPHIADLFTNAAMHQSRNEASSLLAYAYGDAAYARWIDALNLRTVTHQLSVAYNAAVTAEARTYAVRYLQEVQTKSAAQRVAPSISIALGHAQRMYERIADIWLKVTKLFPMPFGADPTAPGPAYRTIQLLEEARMLEREAAAAMEEAAYWVSRQ